MSDSGMSLAPAALVVVLNLEDFDRWKVSFDQVQPKRIESGFIGHHINRAEDDPNRVLLFMPSSDRAKGEAFTQSEELAEIMRNAGVIPPPQFSWAIPRREAAVWEGQLPAMIVQHGVADFESWLEGYNAADGLRSANGIVGHGANQSADDPNMAIIYHQAESFDTLRAFLELPELRSAMEQAGVTSEPEVSFYTGGWGARY